jgi:hypothetical protein
VALGRAKRTNVGDSLYTDLNAPSSPRDCKIYPLFARKAFNPVNEVKNVSDSFAVRGEDEIAIIEHDVLIYGL